VLFVLGPRTAANDTEPAEDQDAFGANIYLKGKTWPISIVLGVHASNGDGTASDPFFFGTFEANLDYREVSVGVGRIWSGSKHARPFIGGGLSVLNVDTELSVASFGGSASDDDTILAPYVDGGIFWRLGKSFNLGLDARFVVAAKAETAVFEGDVNYVQIAAALGWGW
jgi:hypothetical protein